LNRLGADARVIDGVEAAAMGDPVFGPQPTHQRDTSVKPRRALAERNTKGVELRLAIAQSQAEDKVAAG
jgi:hypothetical protein